MPTLETGMRGKPLGDLGPQGVHTFIITGPLPDWVDIAPVLLCLGMLQRVTIDVRAGGQEELSVGALSKTKHVHGAQETCFGGLDWVVPACQHP
jgi:hypothetical protein